MSGKSTGAQANGGGSDARNRSHNDGSSARAFTDEQKAAVVRVRKCKATAFYDILGLESVKTSIDESGIKKAYRKLSLLCHPDKNGYAGADEAFKMVSRAFQILSDADKRRQFDQFGGDPDSRFPSSSAGASSPFAGFGRAAGGQRPGASFFEEEISPEELFRQFFGGGLGGGFGSPYGGGIFDTGPGFVFNLGGGPGIRVHQFGGGRPRRRPAGAQRNEPATAASALSNLLPLLVLFLVPILSSLFSSGGSFFSGSYLNTPSVPIFHIDTPIPPLTQRRETPRLNVEYYVNPQDVEDLKPSKLKTLDMVVERTLLTNLNHECNMEFQRKNQMVQDAQGWFFVDQSKIDQARVMPQPSCQRLQELNIKANR